MAETRDQVEARLDDVRNREVTDIPDTHSRDWDAHEVDLQPAAVTTQSPTTEDPDRLEREIEQTRREMAETLEELQERLDPERLKFEAEWRVDQAVARAKDEVEDATIGRVKDMTYKAKQKADNWRTNMMHTIKDNPVPAALVGVGLGWLIMESSGRNGDTHSQRAAQWRRQGYDEYTYGGYGYGEEGWERERYDADYPGRSARPTYGTEEGYRRARREAGERISDMGQRVQSATEDVRDRAEHLADEASERVSETTEEARARARRLRDEASERVSETTEEVRERAEHLRDEAEREWDELTDEARQRARRMQAQARTQTRHAKRNMEQVMREKPLAVGAAALALGVLVGWAIPATETENRLVGEYRDDFVEQARHEAKSVAQKAQSAAKDAVEDVKEETKSAAKQAADEVSEESKRATQRVAGNQ